MALHLIIDGYNLIRQSPYLSSVELRDFQKGREALLERLVPYLGARGHRISVIFDGWKGGNGQETREQLSGIQVIYSRLGETADEVIKRMVGEERERAVVVTADSDIVAFAHKKKAAVISPHEFEGKLEQALYRANDDSEADGFNPKKKGAARHPSRIQRRSLAKLKKL